MLMDQEEKEGLCNLYDREEAWDIPSGDFLAGLVAGGAMYFLVR